jgi:hypothetical protein
VIISINIFSQAQPYDSNFVKLDKFTLKWVIKNLIELEGSKKIIENKDQEIQNLSDQISIKDKMISARETIIKLLTNNIKGLEESQPAWYNNFFTGFLTASAIVLLSVIIFAK